jgi:hypothetical protein
VFKNFINDIRLERLTYYLEKVLLSKMPEKIKAFNKIKKMKLTDEMGLQILDYSVKDYSDSMSRETFSLSLISLCLDNYKDVYEEKIKEIFPNIIDSNKIKVLTILSFLENESAIRLYKDLVLKYFSKEEVIPIGKLGSNPKNYDLLFPDLYKAFNFEIKRNSILLLLNDFVNKGIVKVDDLKKYKKVLQKEICKIFNEAIKFKFNKDENYMTNMDYVNLRFYLESAINIEFYVSSRESKKLLDKLFTKKDNQLKLFILENYIKKNKKIDKMNLNSIARDKLSRYPLFSLLMYYNLERLMPKKYSNNKALSESDIYLNYAISKNYTEFPTSLKLYKEIEFNNCKYYVYKFKVMSLYKSVINDYATNYIVETIGLNKYNEEKITNNYIGISGGFNKDLNPSVIELNPKNFMFTKTDVINDDIIYDLLSKEEVKQEVKIESIDENVNDIIEENTNLENIEETNIKKFRIISFKTLFIIQFFLILFSFSILFSYVKGYNILKLDVKDKTNDNSISTVYKKTKFDTVSDFNEINASDIFNKEETDYYVLFFKKENYSEYYFYIDYLIKNNHSKFYYVDISKEENKFIFDNNDLNFVIKGDTLLKVNEHEYEFYVRDKTNILKELRTEVDVIKEKIYNEEKKKKDNNTKQSSDIENNKKE